MKTRIWIVWAIYVACSAPCRAEEQYPNLPEPDFEFSNSQSSDLSGSDGAAPDLLSELEELLETPSKRDARAQLNQAKSDSKYEGPIDKVLIDPNTALKIEEKKPEDNSFSDPGETSESVVEAGPRPITKEESEGASGAKTPDKVTVMPKAEEMSSISQGNLESYDLESAINKPKPKKKLVTKIRSPKKTVLFKGKKKQIPFPGASTRLAANSISAIKFLRKDNYHELELQADAPLNFKLQTKKRAKQLVYTFSGVSIPKHLRRAYDTREFNSPIAMYTLGRVKKRRVWWGQLVIQMRELVLPEVIQKGNIFTLQFPDKVEKIFDRKIAAQLPETSLGKDAFDDGRTFSGQRIEKLELKNTDISEALKLVLQPSGYNVIISDEVKGEVGNLSLSDTPWDQAFHLLLKMKSLGYVLRGNVLQIAPVATLQQERELAEKQEETEPLRTVMIPVSYAKAATLAPRAQAFISKRGKVDTDERTNTIIIRDVDSVINRIQKVFNVLDTQPPAVSISAKFVEITKQSSKTLGLASLSLAGQTSGINFGVPQAALQSPGFLATPGSGTINLSAPKFAALNAQLTLAESENEVKILANPTITVQQGQKGNITQGTTTEVPQTLAGAAGGGVGVVQTPLAQTINLTLDVTPIVANDGSISLDTNLLQEQAVPSAAVGGLAKDTRNIKTQIILKNGDTAVLGGIFRGQQNRADQGVPFLRNLPLLGYLFSEKRDSVQKIEILIFITARILNPESAFKQSL